MRHHHPPQALLGGSSGQRRRSVPWFSVAVRRCRPSFTRKSPPRQGLHPVAAPLPGLCSAVVVRSCAPPTPACIFPKKRGQKHGRRWCCRPKYAARSGLHPPFRPLFFGYLVLLPLLRLTRSPSFFGDVTPKNEGLKLTTEITLVHAKKGSQGDTFPLSPLKIAFTPPL